MPGLSVKTCATNPVGMGQCTKTDQPRISVHILIGYMRVSTDSDHQVLDLQRDVLLAAGAMSRAASVSARNAHQRGVSLLLAILLILVSQSSPRWSKI
jgi:hypothetical protein